MFAIELFAHLSVYKQMTDVKLTSWSYIAMLGTSSLSWRMLNRIFIKRTVWSLNCLYREKYVRKSYIKSLCKNMTWNLITNKLWYVIKTKPNQSPIDVNISVKDKKHWITCTGDLFILTKFSEEPSTYSVR